MPLTTGLVALPSLPGGAAAKVADLYEAAWTADTVLDLLTGEITELHLEEQTEDGLGVEFCRVLSSGQREYHSVKRQVPGSVSGWTPSELTRPSANSGESVLGYLFRHLEHSSQARAVFVSQDSARQMRELVERARSASSIEHFLNLLSTDHRDVFDKHITQISRDGSSAYNNLLRCQFETISHHRLLRSVEQRIPALVQCTDGTPADPGTVRRFLEEYAWNRLGGDPITAADILTALHAQGFSEQPLTKSAQIRLAMREQNKGYLTRTQKALINGSHLPRSQATTISRALVAGEPSVLLVGSAGEGKSCLMAQVIQDLRGAGIQHLVVSMDELEGVVSSVDLGRRIGLPASPAIVLGQMAGGSRGVLCVDQLDAVSSIKGRNVQGQRVLDELVEQVSNLPQLRLLLACRSFDLEGDDSLSSLVRGDPPKAHRIDVERLSTEDVHGALATAGMTKTSLAGSQVEILRVPLHLRLFLEGGTDRERFGSPQELFDRYWDEKRRRVDAVTAPGAFASGVERLAELMSRNPQPTAQVRAMAGHEATLDALASEAVVFVEDGAASFFHEQFFDYAFAKTFLGADRDLVDWLVGDEQPLNRRSQVRQVLAFLRSLEGADNHRYLRTVERLLDDDKVRFHIKKLVLDWLNSLADPTSSEWALLEAREEELDWRGVVSNSVFWFDLLRGMGRWEQWLTGDDEGVDRTVMLLSRTRILKERADLVSELIQRHRDQSEEWRGRSWWLVRSGDGYASAKMQELLIDLIADGTLDAPAAPSSFDRDIWTVLYGLSPKAPNFTARVLGAWLDRRVTLAAELGSDDPFGDDSALRAHSEGSGHVIEECGKGAPEEFTRELLPRLSDLDGRLPHQPIYAPGTSSETYGGVHEQMREALAQAMMHLANSDPDGLDSIVQLVTPVGAKCTKWMSVLLLRAWSANPETYADRVVSFVLESSDERLGLEYDASIGPADSFVAVSRQAVATASLHCSEASFRALEDSILGFTPGWEWRARKVGFTRLAVLRALDQGRITEAVRRHVQELERKFPEAQERGSPDPPKEHMVQRAASPVPQEAPSLMSDEAWLSAMTKYSADRPTWRGDDFVGGARELGRELEGAVRAAPERFAALANRMDGSFAPTYFEAILRGLTRDEGSASRPGTLGQVCSVLRCVKELGVEVPGREIAHAISELAREDLPEDIVEMLRRVALEDTSPETDDSSWDPITQAINSGRGAAAVALCRLLFADRSRWSILKPTIEKLVGDPVLAVRSVAVECLTAVLDSERDDALLLFERLVEGADSIFATHHVEGFIHYAMFRDYPRLRPILHEMLASTSAPTVEVGARQVVVAALWGGTQAALEDENLVLALGEAARVGAAETYAGKLADPTVGPKCEVRLREMFDDESEAVRRATGRCWVSLTPDQIASRGSLLRAFAQSQAFVDTRAGLLLRRLEDAQVRLPIEICGLAERAVAEYGERATSIQYAEGGDAYGLSKLLVRLHEETSDPTLRKRILDVIDGMLRAGFLGIDERLKERFER